MAYNVKLEEQIPDYKFPVHETEVTTDSGLIVPGARAIVRGDTDEVVGLVKSTYKVLTHKDALDPILEAFDKRGSKIHQNISLTHNGARMYANIAFQDMERSAGGADRYWPGVTVVNSLDGTRKYHAEISILRLVCTNGMRIPVAIQSFSQHHSKNADYTKAVENIMRIFEMPATFDFITAWNTIPGPNKRDAEVIAEAIESVVNTDGCKFPTKYSDRVTDYYQNAEDGFTVWNFYNAFNSVLEHDMKRGSGKVERARELDVNLFNTFTELYS